MNNGCFISIQNCEPTYSYDRKDWHNLKGKFVAYSDKHWEILYEINYGFARIEYNNGLYIIHSIFNPIYSLNGIEWSNEKPNCLKLFYSRYLKNN